VVVSYDPVDVANKFFQICGQIAPIEGHLSKQQNFLAVGLVLECGNNFKIINWILSIIDDCFVVLYRQAQVDQASQLKFGLVHSKVLFETIVSVAVLRLLLEKTR